MDMMNGSTDRGPSNKRMNGLMVTEWGGRESRVHIAGMGEMHRGIGGK